MRWGAVMSDGSGKESSRAGTKIAYISAAGVVIAALVTGLFLLLSGRDSKTPSAPAAVSNAKVIISVPPAIPPPAAPAASPFVALVGAALQPGNCAYVFSEPKLFTEDRLGCVDIGIRVAIYCTVESTMVYNSTVWDEIYYRTDWGTTGYIPDAYVYTGTNNAVMPSCVT